MKYFNILLLTAAFSMNVSFAVDDPEMRRREILFIQAFKQCTPEGLHKSGNALFRQGKFDEAKTKYSEALGFTLFSEKKRGDCLGKMGIIYSIQNKIDEAIEQFTKLLALPEFHKFDIQDRVDYHLLLAEAYCIKNNIPSAITQYKVALGMSSAFNGRTQYCLKVMDMIKAQESQASNANNKF